MPCHSHERVTWLATEPPPPRQEGQSWWGIIVVVCVWCVCVCALVWSFLVPELLRICLTCFLLSFLFSRVFIFPLSQNVRWLCSFLSMFFLCVAFKKKNKTLENSNTLKLTEQETDIENDQEHMDERKLVLKKIIKS